MSLPVAPKPALRRFHQASWDEPIIFELSTPGRARRARLRRSSPACATPSATSSPSCPPASAARRRPPCPSSARCAC